MKQPAAAAPLGRDARDQLVGQVVVEIAAPHRAAHASRAAADVFGSDAGSPSTTGRLQGPGLPVETGPSSSAAAAADWHRGGHWRHARPRNPDRAVRRSILRHGDAHLHPLAAAQDVELELLAGLIRAQDAKRVARAFGYPTVDPHQHVALLKLIGALVRGAHHEQAFFGAEVLPSRGVISTSSSSPKP